MGKYILLFVIFITLSKSSACQGNNAAVVNKDESTIDILRGNNARQLEEMFVDSTAIGKKRFNKLELARYRISDSSYVIIKFFSKKNGKWELRNRFQFPKDDATNCDPNITDFNNDRLNDVTYVSAVAARSANEVRRLFIYSKVNDSLVYIENSEDYPNMRYNKYLNCIDAFLIYGGCSTIFLKLNNDKLTEIASVDATDDLVVSVYGKDGQGKVIYKKKNISYYIRYKNYKPLIAYDK